MNKRPISYYLEKVTQQSIQEAVNIVMTDDNLKFFNFMSRYMDALKKRGICNMDLENQTHQEIFLYAFCAGVAVQIERQKEPVSKYLKDNEHIFIEFKDDGLTKFVNVTKDFSNKQIKKIISEVIGKEFKGNFRKISEFEHKKFLKQFDGLGI